MKIAVIGTGTVGVMSVLHFLRYIEKAEVTCIYNPKKKILGIGESSNVNLPHLLWEAANYNVFIDSKELSSTVKLGVKYRNWRKNDFISPILPTHYAMHFDNFALSEKMFARAKKLYGKKFKILNKDIKELKQNEKEVTILFTKGKATYDYVIDCRGYPDDYSNYHMITSLPINRAFVNLIPEPGDWDYTYHYAHKNGWMFEIPLTNRQSYGYLFNDTITSIEEAKEDFSKEIMVPVSLLNNIEYKFKSYYSKTVFDGRIMKNGNAAIFFEPISATSLWLYDNTNRLLFDYMTHNNLRNTDLEPTIENVNKEFHNIANHVEELICYYYHGGSIYDTPFWKHTVDLTSKRLEKSENLQRMISGFQEAHKNGTPVNAGQWCFTAPGLSKIDKNFGYNYFNNKELDT